TTVSPEKPWMDLEKVEHIDWVLSDDVELRLGQTANDNEVSRMCAWTAAAREPNKAHRPKMLASMTAAALNDAAVRHDGIFASLAAGYAGAPLLPCPSTERADDFSVAAVFASALSEIMRGDVRDTARESVTTVDGADGTHLRVLSVTGRRGVAAWIQDERA